VIDKFNQVSLIKKWYNPKAVAVAVASIIGLIAYLTLDTTPDELLFRAYAAIVFAPVGILLVIGLIYSTRTYPSQIIFDFEKEHILLGSSLTVKFDEVKVGRVHSKFGFIGVTLVLSSAQEYSYRNFFTCDIDETEFASLLKNVPSIKYDYENKV